LFFRAHVADEEPPFCHFVIPDNHDIFSAEAIGLSEMSFERGRAIVGVCAQPETPQLIEDTRAGSHPLLAERSHKDQAVRSRNGRGGEHQRDTLKTHREPDSRRAGSSQRLDESVIAPTCRHGVLRA